VAEISAQAVKALREQTGAGMMDCKKVLADAGGDLKRAIELLRERGLAKAGKREGRATSEGVIAIATEGPRGGIVELGCETDFVARTDDFKTLAHDIAMQVAATNPLSVAEEDLPTGAEGDPAELCLLRQPFIKDPSRNIEDVVKDVIAKTGENVRVHRFSRFELGQ
jgi:elongation factor Ts